jgi:hypothetical protein
VKRFVFDDESASSGEGGTHTPSGQHCDAPLQPLPGFDPRTLPQAEWPLPQVPPKVQQTVSSLVREAIDAGLSLAETYAGVKLVLLRHNLHISEDDLTGWVGSHALAVT